MQWFCKLVDAWTAHALCGMAHKGLPEQSEIYLECVLHAARPRRLLSQMIAARWTEHVWSQSDALTVCNAYSRGQEILGTEVSAGIAPPEWLAALEAKHTACRVICLLDLESFRYLDLPVAAYMSWSCQRSAWHA